MPVMLLLTWRKALANDSIAMDSFPGVVAASLWTALAISISEQPEIKKLNCLPLLVSLTSSVHDFSLFNHTREYAESIMK